MEEELPCETLMVMTSLMNDPCRRIDIPVLATGGERGALAEGQGTHVESTTINRELVTQQVGLIHGISPSLLYLAIDGRDPVVGRELQGLIQSGTVCKLRLEEDDCVPPSSSSYSTSSAMPVGTTVGRDSYHQVLVLKSEYNRAAFLSCSHLFRSSPGGPALPSTAELGKKELRRQIVEWFLHESRVVDLISESEVEHSLREYQQRQRLERTQSQREESSPASSMFLRCSASVVLSELQHLQLLRSFSTAAAGGGGAHLRHHRRVFQLWLPSWGAVSTSFQRSSAQLLAALRRSQYKERSASWLDQRTFHKPTSNRGTKNSNSLRRQLTAIPFEVLLEHLVSQGRVVRVNRPSGTFVKLVW